MFDQEVLQTVLTLTALSWGIVNGLATPLFEKNSWDKFYLMYVAWVISGILVALSGANIFANGLLPGLAGQVVTALVAGILSNFIHDISDPAPQVLVSADHATVDMESVEPSGKG